MIKGFMFTLFHHPFCPHSRFIRLTLGEHGLDLRLVEERAWERREAFLALNPAGSTPVLISESQPAIPGAAIIAEYLDETHGADLGERRLLPTAMGERIEVRRLMAWFNDKFFEEASNPLVTERIYKRFMSEDHGGGAPAADVIRAAKANVRYHLAYIGWLGRAREFLGGGRAALCGFRAGCAVLLGPCVPTAPLKRPPAEVKAALASEARALGFDCVGVTDPDAIADAGPHFRAFLDAGAHGDMDWLPPTPESHAPPPRA